MYGCIAYIHVTAPKLYNAHRGQERASDPMEPKLLGTLWILGAESGYPARVANVLGCCATSPVPLCLISYSVRILGDQVQMSSKPQKLLP